MIQENWPIKECGIKIKYMEEESFAMTVLFLLMSHLTTKTSNTKSIMSMKCHMKVSNK